MDISIIVPIYNVEQYIIESLESILKNIQNIEAEVLLIDDGSTDKSGMLAHDYTESHKEFHYWRKENGGSGSARNFGVRHASGEYLLFVDPDDILLDGILEKMLYAANTNHTDLTICEAGRIRGSKIEGSNLHLRAFHNLSGNITHVKEHTNLVYDAMIWNKLIRRDFYLRHKFSFPEGCFYQDMGVILPMHYHANAVSVVYETGYLWRIRTGENGSATQVLNKKNFSDKIRMYTELFQYVDHNINETHIRKALEIKAGTVDFMPFINIMEEVDDVYADYLMNTISSFLKTYLSGETFDELPIFHRQIYEYLFQHDLEKINIVKHYRDINYWRLPVVNTDGILQFMVREEFFTIAGRNIRNEDFLNKPPDCWIDDVNIDDNNIKILGHIYFGRINIPTPEKQRITAFLQEEVSGEKIALTAESCECSFLSKKAGNILNYDDYKIYSYNYDGTGFKLYIDMDELLRRKQGNHTWTVFIGYENLAVVGNRILRGIGQGAKRIIEGFSIQQGDKRGYIEFDKRNSLLVKQKTLPDNINRTEDGFPTAKGVKEKKCMSDGGLKNTALLSIIIPVYNVERYLEEALSSVCRQSLMNMEIICINDGSTDGSAEILEAFQKTDDRIRIIHQENQGLSAARNRGLEAASGKYVYYFDSDDLLADDALELLVSRMEADHLDLLFFDVEPFADQGVPDKTLKSYEKYYHREGRYPGVLSGAEMMVRQIEADEFLVGVWSHMGRRSFIETHGLRFIEGILHEDNYYTFCAMLLAERTGYLNRIFFKRRLRNGSITQSKKTFSHAYGYFLTHIKALEAYRQALQREEIRSGQKTWLEKPCLIEMIGKWLRSARNVYAALDDAEKIKAGLLEPEEEILFRRYVEDVVRESRAKQDALKARDKAEADVRRAEEKIAELKKDTETLEQRICQIENSRAYRFGTMAAKPVRRFRKRAAAKREKQTDD